MKKIINKLKFWKRNRKMEAIIEALPPPVNDKVSDDEMSFHEGHPV